MVFAFFVSVSAPAALAEISLLLFVDAVNDRSGSDVSTSLGSWLLVADTNRDGFGPLRAGPISLGSQVGSSDLIIARGDFTIFATPGVVSANPTRLSFASGWDEGDPIALVWLPGAGSNPTVLAVGDDYGLYHSPTGQDTSARWITPADGTLNYGLHLLTSDGNGFFGAGSVSPASAIASLQVGEPSGDSDNDGMPDDWETANGLDPQDPADAVLDGDGDGRDNLNEHLAGTDPNNPRSVLKILSVNDKTGDQSVFELTWSSVADQGVTYAISTSPDLASWTSVITGIISGGATTQRDVSVAAPGDARFFRVSASR